MYLDGKKLISIKETCTMVCISRVTLWKKYKAGQFPRPIRLSEDGNKKAFVVEEVEAWINSPIAARDGVANDRA